MKYLYVKSVFLWLSAVSVALLGACSGESFEPSYGDEGAISFSTPQTRAAIEDASNMKSFSVWGWYKNTITEGSPLVSAFDNTTVTQSSNGWNYEGGTRYWIPGNTYNFYAVYPTGKGSYNSEGVLTVPSFDCSATGNDAVDLMTAVSSRIYDGTDASAVSMQFSHLLAKIDFVGKNEGGNATVSKIELSNVYTQGTYTSSDNPLWSELTSQPIVINKSTALTPEGVSVSGDVLLIPQTLNNPQLTVTYSTDTETRTETYTLPVDMVSSWGAGQSYRYSFTVTGGGYIIFDAPTVNKWGTATGGNITIDVTEPNS